MKNIEIMFENAQKQALLYKHIYHYTSIDVLEKILKNKSFMLKRIDTVNDLMEHQRFDKFLNKKAFVACFSYRKYESYFFWRTYSKDKSGIRITFPKDILNQKDFYFDAECSRSMFYINRTDFYNNVYNSEVDWGLLKTYASRIIYTNDLNKYKKINMNLKETYGNCVNFKGESFEYHELPCFIKTSEWDSEKETRLAVFVRPKGQEDISGKTVFDEHTYPQPPFEKIFMKLTEELLSKCIFTLSPFCNKEYKEKAIDIIKGCCSTRKCTIKDSVMIVKPDC